MHTNIEIEIHSESGVLPCFLRNDCFRHPLKVRDITRVNRVVFRKVMMYWVGFTLFIGHEGP
jgi:hypothetical protein